MKTDKPQYTNLLQTDRKQMLLEAFKKWYQLFPDDTRYIYSHTRFLLSKDKIISFWRTDHNFNNNLSGNIFIGTEAFYESFTKEEFSGLIGMLVIYKHDNVKLIKDSETEKTLFFPLPIDISKTSFQEDLRVIHYIKRPESYYNLIKKLIHYRAIPNLIDKRIIIADPSTNADLERLFLIKTRFKLKDELNLDTHILDKEINSLIYGKKNISKINAGDPKRLDRQKFTKFVKSQDNMRLYKTLGFIYPIVDKDKSFEINDSNKSKARRKFVFRLLINLAYFYLGSFVVLYIFKPNVSLFSIMVLPGIASLVLTFIWKRLP